MSKKEIKIYQGLVIILAIFSALSIYLPQNSNMPVQNLPTSKSVLALLNALIMLFIYGGLGYIGLKLSAKINFASIWDPDITIKEKLVKPGLIGVGLGLFIILIDILFSKYNSFGRLPHPVFPTSLVASLTAGIGEELLFRLFFISFWVWLIYYKILKKKYYNLIFWLVAAGSALAFSLAHLPSIMFLTGVKSIQMISKMMILELILINGSVSIFAAYYFRKNGILAAVSIHFWTDLVWHVIWGLF